MQALTDAASSGIVELLDCMIKEFNMTLTSDNRVGVCCSIRVMQQCVIYVRSGMLYSLYKE